MKKIIVGLVVIFAALGAFANTNVYTAIFRTNWKQPDTIKTKGKLVLPHPNNLNGNMFIGWKADGKMYSKWDVLTMTKDMDFRPTFEKLDLSKFMDGTSEPTKHETGHGIFYAIGDSITFGTKAGNEKGAWPKYVAEALALDLVNDAKAGSRLSAWRSVLTQSKNHNQYVEDHVKGVTRNAMLEEIRRAGVIGFTLGVNDLMFNNKGDDIVYRMYEFVEALHHENPQALIIAVVCGDLKAFQDGGKYADLCEESKKYHDGVLKVLNGPKCRDYCVAIDVADIFRDDACYKPCEREPDGIHPGFDGQKRLAERVLKYVSACANAKAAPKYEFPEENEIADEAGVELPTKEEMWSYKDADKVKTVTRAKVCLNGLWAFKVDNGASDFSASPKVSEMPNFFKVPGEWPKDGGHDRIGMAVYNALGGEAYGSKVRKVDSAWYGRKVIIPENWADKKVILGFAWVPSAMMVYVDGKKAGEVFFPGGEVDLTAALTPGEHEIALFTTKKIAEKMMTAFDAPDTARQFSKKEIDHAGIMGDVYLAGEPKKVKILSVQARPSVTKGRLDFAVELTGEKPAGASFVAEVYDGDKLVKTFKGEDLIFGGEWKDAKVWDLDRPQNLYTMKVRMLEGTKVVDELYPETFGFREIKLKGKDIILNGSVVHFRPCNTEYSRQGAVANEDVRKAALDCKKRGFNSWVPTSNYGFQEGDTIFFEMMAREASAVGMGVVIGLPHPKDFDDPKNPHHWQFGPAYDNLVKHMIRRLQNIPGVLYYSSTHNQTGYESDQNPAIISGKPEEIPSNIVNWRQRFRKLALTVNEKFKEFDPTRPVYHHESGAEGDFYTLNCYLDWAPIQERSDWFEHWELTGIMPLIVVEWGAPHIASWSTFRGPNKNIWSARDWTQHCWLTEYNSMFLGEKAFTPSDAKKKLFDRTELKCKGNAKCYYGGNFTEPLEDDLDTSEVIALYEARNYRDMRARGVTSFLPWDIDGRMFYFDVPDEEKAKKPREGALEGLKKFGVVKSDYFYRIFDQYQQKPRKTAEVLTENYKDLLGWVAGPSKSEFTRVNDTYRIGEEVKKSLVILNDSRRTRTIQWVWKAGANHDRGEVEMKPGTRVDIPVVFKAEADTTQIAAGFKCESTHWKHRDTFKLNIVPAAKCAVKSVKVYDPEGTLKPVLSKVGVKSDSNAEVMVFGRNALSSDKVDFAALVKKGGKILVLEQNAAILKKLGFRTQEYGLRNMFAFDKEFADLDLTDWRGNSTMISEYLPEDPMKGDWAYGEWEGFKHRKCWRAGNRGIVASILPEKPTKGDYRALVHGCFNLQYAPVMEYRSENAVVVFSQLDICGRTESSPEAENALVKLIEYTAKAKMPVYSRTLVLNSKEIANCFDKLGIIYENVDSVDAAKGGDILCVSEGTDPEKFNTVAEKGVKVVCLGLKAANPKRNVYPAYNEQIFTEPFFVGISNADLQWVYPSVMAPYCRPNDQVLALTHHGEGVVIVDSVVPWAFDENEIALRVNRRRSEGLITRLIANLGGKFATGSLYADKPVEDDNPFRYYRW